MGIAFLNPWFWLGALALAAPLWLHLKRKREKKLVQFTGLRFLDDEPQARQSPRRLRHLLLFLLRALALLLVVTAFAWPYIRAAQSGPIKASVVYILDNTLSHQANGGFQKDRDRVAREIAEAG